MKFTTQPPSVPGWYWYGGDSETVGICAVKVYYGDASYYGPDTLVIAIPGYHHIPSLRSHIEIAEELGRQDVWSDEQINPPPNVLKLNADIAREFSAAGFKSVNHRRKYTGDPYEVHTIEVAEIVASVTDDDDLIAAAHLHDTAEDVNVYPYNLDGIGVQFGHTIRQHVEDLTDVYTKDKYPTHNRARRKELEAERLAKVSPGSQTIKLADIISNTRDIVKNDPVFAVTYLKEMWDLLPVLREGHSTLWEQANGILGKEVRRLGIERGQIS